jgi:hypothetical protein
MREAIALYQSSNVVHFMPKKSFRLDGNEAPHYAVQSEKHSVQPACKVIPFYLDSVEAKQTYHADGLCLSDRPEFPGSKLYIKVTAYHEAGHAIAALYEGRDVLEVSASFSRPGNGLCRSLNTGRNPYDVTMSPGAALAAWNHTLKSTLADVRIYLAGPLAEAKILGKPLRSHGAESDLEYCMAMISKLGFLSEFISSLVNIEQIDPVALLNHERQKVRRWLAQPKVWACVRLVALNLLASGKVNRNELEYITHRQGREMDSCP